MKIYLDMDDVLVDYVHNIAKHFDIELDELYRRWTPGVYQVYHAVGLPDDVVWREVKSQPPEFWATMPAFPWSMELYKIAEECGDTEILTAPVNSWTCVAGKVQWLHKFFGEDFIKYHIAKSKWDCARWNHILIDDKEDNIKKFKEAGGEGILFPSQGNALHEKRHNPMAVVVPQLKEMAMKIRERELGNDAFWASIRAKEERQWNSEPPRTS